MTDPLEAPVLADQPVEPYGTWTPDPVSPPDAPAMVWRSAADYDGRPRGPLLPQVHDSGTWVPGRGESMTWVPAVEPVDAPTDTPGGDA